MTRQPTEENRPSPPASRRRGTGRDRAVKLAFVAAAIAVAAAVWWYQRTGPHWPGWEQDLTAALARAKSEDRKVLVLFTASPPGHFAREFRSKTLAKRVNKKAIADARLLQVRLCLDTKLDSQAARRYAIRKLPTLLLLDSDGKELNRRQGEKILSETGFHRGFLDCKDVAPPRSAPARE